MHIMHCVVNSNFHENFYFNSTYTELVVYLVWFIQTGYDVIRSQ